MRVIRGDAFVRCHSADPSLGCQRGNTPEGCESGNATTVPATVILQKVVLSAKNAHYLIAAAALGTALSGNMGLKPCIGARVSTLFVRCTNLVGVCIFGSSTGTR